MPRGGPLTQEQKDKMAAGRRRAALEKRAAKEREALVPPPHAGVILNKDYPRRIAAAAEPSLPLPDYAGSDWTFT